MNTPSLWKLTLSTTVPALALLALTALAQGAEPEIAALDVTGAPTVTRKAAELKADVTDIESAATVVVKNPRLEVTGTTEVIPFITLLSDRAKSMNGDYICAKLGYGAYLADTMEKSKTFIGGKLVAFGQAVDLLMTVQLARDEMDFSLGSLTCLKK